MFSFFEGLKHVLIFSSFSIKLSYPYRFIGNIEYFNTTLEESEVIFLDGTSDYIPKDDFDGVQVIFL